MTLEAQARVRPATVAIVGRPNVGKSALFNRLVGKRMAIVDDEPGVTRDRLYALAEWRGRTFSVIDTAGIDPAAPGADDMARQTRAQAEIAAHDADGRVAASSCVTCRGAMAGCARRGPGIIGHIKSPYITSVPGHSRRESTDHCV